MDDDAELLDGDPLPGVDVDDTSVPDQRDPTTSVVGVVVLPDVAGAGVTGVGFAGGTESPANELFTTAPVTGDPAATWAAGVDGPMS